MPGDSFRRAHDRPFLADSAAVSISSCVVTSNMCPSLPKQAGPGAGLVTTAPEWGRPEYTDDTRSRDFYILIDLLQVKIILIVLLQVLVDGRAQQRRFLQQVPTCSSGVVAPSERCNLRLCHGAGRNCPQLNPSNARIGPPPRRAGAARSTIQTRARAIRFRTTSAARRAGRTAAGCRGMGWLWWSWRPFVRRYLGGSRPTAIQHLQ